MAFIVETISLDRSLQFGNEEFGRVLSMGTNWSMLRIGVRMAVNTTGGIIRGGFVMGVCQGSTNMYKSLNTTDFMGMCFGGNIDVSDYLFTVGPPGYISYSGQLPIITRVGSTTTLKGGNNPGAFMSAQPNTTVSNMFVDITKGSSYSVAAYIPTSAGNAQANTSLSTFLTSMENDTAVPTNTAAAGAITFVYSGAGLFDTVNIAWNHSVPSVTIYDLAVCRFL